MARDIGAMHVISGEKHNLCLGRIGIWNMAILLKKKLPVVPGGWIGPPKTGHGFISFR